MSNIAQVYRRVHGFPPGQLVIMCDMSDLEAADGQHDLQVKAVVEGSAFTTSAALASATFVAVPGLGYDSDSGVFVDETLDGRHLADRTLQIGEARIVEHERFGYGAWGDAIARASAALTRFELGLCYRNKTGGGLVHVNAGRVGIGSLIGETPEGALVDMRSKNPAEWERVDVALWQEAWNDPRSRDIRGESGRLGVHLSDGDTMTLRDVIDEGAHVDSAGRTVRGDEHGAMPADVLLTIEQRALAHDDAGRSEEMCVRCGWVMGHPPLNCQNDNTPHVFPSQLTIVDAEIVDEIARDREALLRTTTDAAVWAREFIAVIDGPKAVAVDEGLMIAWFANAIETAKRITQERMMTADTLDRAAAMRRR